MEILTILATIILPLLIGFILGRSRDSDKIIFNRKLEIYSDIVYHLSSAKYLRFNLDISLDKAKSLISEIDTLQEKEGVKPKKYLDTETNKKLEELDTKVSLLGYRDSLIKLFAPARLLGSKNVVNELREYFSLISEYHSVKDIKDVENISKKISKSVMELEQLMRKDLGRFRLLSRLEILYHLYRN